MEDSIKKLFDIDPNKIPSSIPLFPLENVLLLPFGKLPLNIFEERYINMVLDSLKTHRMIGIIQPKNNNNDFFMMGCIGKITSYIETPDYRLVLNLEGVCRFVLHERNLTPKGYYQASIDTSDYLDDLNSMEILTDRFEPAGEVDDAVWEYFEYLEEANEEINLKMMDGWHVDENEILSETVDAIEDWFRAIEYERNGA